MQKSYESIQMGHALTILGRVYAVPGSAMLHSRARAAAIRLMIGDYVRALALCAEVEAMLRDVPSEQLGEDFATLREILATLVEREDELRAA